MWVKGRVKALVKAVLKCLFNCTPDGLGERDTEIQIDGQLFGGVRGRVLFSTENLETGAEMDSPVARLKPVTDNR